MTAALLVFAAMLGLVIGSFLNVVAYRVPAQVSLMRDSRCPHCDTPIRWHQNIPVFSWLFLRGRCANCHAPISARYPIVEAVTGAAFVIVTWWELSLVSVPTELAAVSPTFWVVLIAYLYFASISIVLTLIDIDVHRLPNGIVLPSYLVGGILFTIACVFGESWSKLLTAALGMVVLYVFYSFVRLISPRGMGGGDVKLAGVIGLYLGWMGWPAVVVGAFAAFVLGGLFGLILIAARRAGRKSAIPFGPWMIIGAWAGLFAGESVSHWYLGMYS